MRKGKIGEINLESSKMFISEHSISPSNDDIEIVARTLGLFVPYGFQNDNSMFSREKNNFNVP